MGAVNARGCSEWRGAMAMDAVGRASAEESRELAGHLEGCAGCQADAEEVLAAAAALGLLDSVQVHRLERGSPPRDVVEGGDLLAEAEGGTATGERPILEAVVGTDRRGRPAAPAGVGGRPDGARRRLARRWVTLGAAAALGAAVVAAIFLNGSSPSPRSRTIALSGRPGVTASISLFGQAWGTRAVLRESGEPPGQLLTVSMRASGQWWVAGSYRTAAATRALTVQFSCAVPAREITNVWVTDPEGHTVLSGGRELTGSPRGERPGGGSLAAGWTRIGWLGLVDTLGGAR